MAERNMEVANQFNKLANLLEIEGANPFRVRAYRTAARVVAGLAKNIADLVAQNEDLTSLPGVGADLAEKIKIIVTTGELPLLKEVQARLPPLLNELMEIEGLGPKRIQIIYKKLKIENITDLKNAIANGELQEIKGFGEKIEKKILQGLEHISEPSKRIALGDAIPIVTDLTAYLKICKIISKVTCAGSFRRHKETLADLDFVVTAEKSTDAINHFINYAKIAEIHSQGSTRSSVRLHSGIQVDLRVVPEKSYGAALLYFTGSKDHNIAIRKMAVHKKLKINEYGVFKGNKQIAGKTEEEVYQQVNLPYIEAELREDRGEIEAAQEGKLPALIDLKNIKGDFCFLEKNTLDEIAEAAQKRNYKYMICICTFDKLNEKLLTKKLKFIDAWNDKNSAANNFTFLTAINVEILTNGKLSLSDDMLKEFDFTLCAIHKNFTLPAAKQTQRIIRAMDNHYFSILAHPNGRNTKSPYALELEKILYAAKERSRIVELNIACSDLNDVECKLAKTIGTKIAINSTAHNINELNLMEFGIFQSRRGWLSKSDVINTLPIDELLNLAKRDNSGNSINNSCF